ncbi:hypothetical protein EAI_02391, partial [Harpegnathos saltator]
LKRARNGGVIMEIPGRDSRDKADRLARELQDALCGEAVVARPARRTELRLVGLDDSVTPQMIRAAILKMTSCPPELLQIGEIRRSTGGLGAIWVRCPLDPAQMMASAGGLYVGWSWAKVRLLEERALQCYRCLRYGHMAVACRAEEVLGGNCFRCGGEGHVARGCTAE